MPKFISDADMAKLDSKSPSGAAPKKKFISDAEMAQAESGSGKPSIGETLSVKGQEGLMLGFRPVVGGIGAAIGEGLASLEQGGKGAGYNIPKAISAAKQGFQQGRQETVAEQDRISEARPGLSAVANIAGSIATAPLLPIKGLKGAVALGTGMGVGEGASRANTKGEFAASVGTGAAAGALGFGVAKAAGGTLNAASSKLQNFGETKAFKAAGAMLKDFRKAFKHEKVNELGRTLLDNGIVKSGDDVASIAQKSESLKQQTGQQIGEIYQKVQSVMSDPNKMGALPPEARLQIMASGFKPKQDAEALKLLIESEFKGKPGSTKVINQVGQVIDEISVNGDDLTPKQALEIKGQIDGLINWSKKSNEMPDVQQGLMTVRNFISEKINHQVGLIDQVVQSPQSKELLRLNKLYGNLSEITSIAKDKISRENSNAMFGLRDTGFAIGGAGVGAVGPLQQGDLEGALKGAALGATAGLASKGARMYGNAIQAKLADSASRLLSTRAPQAATQIGLAQPIASKALSASGAKPSLEQLLTGDHAVPGNDAIKRRMIKK